MANSDKNIKITPNISQTAQPNIVLTGQGNVPITLKVLDDSYGTLSFEGSAGQLFSVNNNLTSGVIFSVNDVSGIPQIDVNADGTIRLAPYGTMLYVGGISGSAVTIQPATRASTGAGANLVLEAGDGVTTGAGGSVILQPGSQASSGGNGNVKVYGGVLAIRNESRTSEYATLTASSVSSGGVTDLTIYSNYWIYLSCNTVSTPTRFYISSSPYCYLSNEGLHVGSGYVGFRSGGTNTGAPTVSLVNGDLAVLKLTDGSTGGGSFAFKSSSPSAYTTNQNDLVLTGSAFQRLSGTAARDITGVAPPSGGSHVDGRMLRIYNVGSFNLTLKHNSASSTAANRFFCVQSADVVIATNDFAELIYDSTNNGSGAAGWRVA